MFVIRVRFTEHSGREAFVFVGEKGYVAHTLQDARKFDSLHSAVCAVSPFLAIQDVGEYRVQEVRVERAT